MFTDAITMFKALILFLCALTSCYAHAISLNKKSVLSSNQIYIAPQSAALINDQLFYWQSFHLLGGQPAFYALNPETGVTTKLTEGQLNPLNQQQFYLKSQGELLFMIVVNGEAQLWKTDGTTAGTERLYDNPINSKIRINQAHFYFVEGFSGRTVVSDGQGFARHEIYDLNLQGDAVCAFSLNHIIANTNPTEAGPGPMLRSNMGVVTELDISIPDNESHFVVDFINHDGACYAFIPTENGGTDLWKFTDNGGAESLTSLLGTDPIRGLLAHQGRLYVRQSNEPGTDFTIKRLSQDDAMVDAVYSDPNNPSGLAITSWSSVGDFIAIHTTTPTASPAVNSVFILDKNLPQYPLTLDLFPFQTPTAHPTKNGWVIASYRYQPNGLVNTEVAMDAFQSNQKSLGLPLGDDIQVITDEASDALYIVAENTLYQIESTPDIGAIVTGGWYDPTIENQGLNLFKGRRLDGTEYVSVTGYTYLDGEPFWFAGAAEFNLPSQSLTVELYRYSGPDLFEANNTPERQTFGQLELMMSSCNQLSATLITAEQTIDLNLHRLDDESFNQTCRDYN